jgi:hypothetical protein
MNNLSITDASIWDEIKLHYKYKISYDKTWVAKQKMIEHLLSSHKVFFKKLSRLLLAIKESNPRTSVDWTQKWYLNDKQWLLQDFFLLFEPYIEGFMCYRPLISVAKTYLYGRYDEKLLIAVTFYTNNEIFSLAFAIVNEEHNDN